jgi:UDPglucose 6-dehydrogenase
VTAQYQTFLAYHALAFIVKGQVTIFDSALEACQGAEAVVIATEWKEFKTIDWQSIYNGMSKPAFVFDGRLLLDVDTLKKIGFKVGAIPFYSCY